MYAGLPRERQGGSTVKSKIFFRRKIFLSAQDLILLGLGVTLPVYGQQAPLCEPLFATRQTQAKINTVGQTKMQIPGLGMEIPDWQTLGTRFPQVPGTTNDTSTRTQPDPWTTPPEDLPTETTPPPWQSQNQTQLEKLWRDLLTLQVGQGQDVAKLPQFTEFTGELKSHLNSLGIQYEEVSPAPQNTFGPIYRILPIADSKTLLNKMAATLNKINGSRLEFNPLHNLTSGEAAAFYERDKLIHLSLEDLSLELDGQLLHELVHFGLIDALRSKPGSFLKTKILAPDLSGQKEYSAGFILEEVRAHMVYVRYSMAKLAKVVLSSVSMEEKAKEMSRRIYRDPFFKRGLQRIEQFFARTANTLDQRTFDDVIKIERKAPDIQFPQSYLLLTMKNGTRVMLGDRLVVQYSDIAYESPWSTEQLRLLNDLSAAIGLGKNWEVQAQLQKILQSIEDRALALRKNAWKGESLAQKTRQSLDEQKWELFLKSIKSLSQFLLELSQGE